MARVLVTNDDGINAAGLRELVKRLTRIADVYVFAPEKQNSGKGQAMSYKEGFSVIERKIQGAIRTFEVKGTPTDCVKFGIKYMKERNLNIDFVMSGINHGGNTGNFVTYSGTCGAAREGAFAGIHSIALSVISGEAKEFDYLCNMLPELMEISKELDPSVFLNVNAPNIPSWKVKGTKIIGAAPNCFGLSYDPVDAGDGNYKYEIVRRDYDKDADNDYAQVRQNYVTVTPITTDVTDESALRRMNRMNYDNAFCVVIDLQEKLVPAMRKPEKLLQNTGKLLRCLDRIEVPVVLTEQYAKGLGNTVPEIKAAVGGKDIVVDKVSFDAFETEEFSKLMDSATGRHVILCGAESHICVMLTARSFIERGFEVYVAKDCCASREKASHEAAMEELRAMGAKVWPWESIVYNLLGSSRHPAFRSISAIVKED